MAVNTNQKLEGQIHFLGQFTLTGIPETPSNPTGSGAALTFTDQGVLTLAGKDGKLRVTLDGNVGDITLAGADCAERFVLEEPECNVEPGTVMVLGDGGGIRISRRSYDKRVVGVISGAGDARPAVVLGTSVTRGRAGVIALIGRVFGMVDADVAPIDIGDLLTTSERPGHAMKAVDPSRSHGATIGKALGRLNRGQGLVPILVSLR